MAEGNGHSPDGMLVSEYEDFQIGGSTIRVAELKLGHLDKVREPMLALDGEMWWADYAMTVCKIIAILKPNVGDPESLYNKCSIREARALSTSWNSLLLKSGFEPLGEAPAAVAEESPGTGISTPSSQNLELETFATETPTILDKPLP